MRPLILSPQHLPLHPMLTPTVDPSTLNNQQPTDLFHLQHQGFHTCDPSRGRGGGGGLLQHQGGTSFRGGRFAPSSSTTTGGGNRWQGPATLLVMGGAPSRRMGTGKVVQTPERPLLTDFPSPGQMSNQHIYMEVNNYEPWINDHAPSQPAPALPPQRGTLHQQPQHFQQQQGGRSMTRTQQQPQTPLHTHSFNGVDSSSSSQSSGYGSGGIAHAVAASPPQQGVFSISQSGAPNSGVPSHELGGQASSRRARPNNLFGPGQKRAGGNNGSRARASSRHRRNLENGDVGENGGGAVMLEDSQII